MSELKPCLSCGVCCELDFESGLYYVSCPHCALSSCGSRNKEQAIEMHNTRPAEESLKAQLQVAVAILKELQDGRADVEAKYFQGSGEIHTALMHKFKRDIEPFDKCDKFLANCKEGA